MGLGDMILDAIKGAVNAVLSIIPETMKKGVIDDLKKEVSEKSLHPERYDDPVFKKALEKLKEDFSHSPEGSADIGEGFIGVLAGFQARGQFEQIMNLGIDDSTPFTNRVFQAIAGVTQMSEVAAIMGIVGGAIPLTNLQAIGTEMHQYLSSSGVAQISGFGYGNILSEALSPMISEEMNGLFLRTRLGIGDMTHLLHRKIIDIDAYLDSCKKDGISPELANNFFEGTKYYPSPGDFIRFAVREVYDETVVKKYGYDTNFPAYMKDKVEKAGMSIEQLKSFWRAHWELPSPLMGFEMLHRGIINDKTLEELLLISDYAPGWVKHMMDVSYTPYTRVDARRLFELDVLTEEEYLKSLHDIGYNDERAGKMLEWAKLQKRGPEKDLTRAMVLKAYEYGLVTSKAALEYLKGIGYDSEESELILDLEDTRREQQVTLEEIKVLNFRFSRDQMTIGEYDAAMVKLGIPLVKAQAERVKARQMHEKRIKLPTKVDIEDWFKKGLIKIDDYKVKLSSIGYQPADIELFAKAVLI